MHMFGGYGNMGFGGPIIGMLFMILFWGAIIWLLVSLFRKGKSDSTSGSGDSSMEILKNRYAKGEITLHEFEKMKKDLQKND